MQTPLKHVERQQEQQQQLQIISWGNLIETELLLDRSKSESGRQQAE